MAVLNSIQGLLSMSYPVKIAIFALSPVLLFLTAYFFIVPNAIKV